MIFLMIIKSIDYKSFINGDFLQCGTQYIYMGFIGYFCNKISSLTCQKVMNPIQWHKYAFQCKSKQVSKLYL